jgi:hypothetical protein
MEEDFDKHGVEILYPEVESEDEVAANKVGSNADIEEDMEIFAGSTRWIIGPGGAKLKEIKAISGVKDIQVPPKPEDGTQQRARDLVTLTLKGTQAKIAKARELIKVIVDDWANKPKPNRDAGGQSGGWNTSEDTNGDSGAEPAEVVVEASGGWATTFAGGGDGTADAGVIDWATGDSAPW